MFIRNTIVLCCALALAGCGGPSASQGVTKAKEQTGFLGSRNDDFAIQTGEAFKGADEVTIGGFVVSFYTYSSNKAKAGGGLMGNGMGGKSTAKAKLVGVSDDVMQKITDEAYKNFLAGLKAKGYKVADRAALVNSPEFASVKAIPSPMEDSTDTLLTSGNKVKYFAPSGFSGIYAFPGVPTGFDLNNPAGAAAQYAQKNSKRVLYVSLNVNFANADGSGGWFRTTSSMNVGQGITVVPGASQVGIIGGHGGTFSTNIGSIALGQPISSDKEFAKVSDSTSDASRTMEVAANVIGVIGGVGTNASRDYEFRADPAKFKAGALEAIKSANSAFVGKMSELK